MTMKFFPKMLKKSFILSFLIFLTGFSQGFQSTADEYNLKAAFIYNFTRFIEWPVSGVGNNFIIGIVGDSPIDDPLAEIVATSTVNDKKIIITHFKKAEEISFCNILFIPKNSSIPLETVLEKAASKGTLIVSEKEGCGKKGTAINFLIINSKLKFEANMKALNDAGLKVSSQLLKLAIIIE